MEQPHSHVMERDEKGREAVVACLSEEGAIWEAARLQHANPTKTFWPERAAARTCPA